MLILTIHKGDPSPDDWKKIGEMIQDGYHVGIDLPVGINWSVEMWPTQRRRFLCNGFKVLWKPGSNTK